MIGVLGNVWGTRGQLWSTPQVLEYPKLGGKATYLAYLGYLAR
jgi:hypothetical protein